MKTQTMIAPDNTTGDVPVERLEEAKAAGFELAVKMRNPNTQTEQHVPYSLVDVHLSAGFKIVHE